MRKWWNSLTAKEVHDRVLFFTILFGVVFLMWQFLVGGFWHAMGATIVYMICGVIVNLIVSACVVDKG